MKNNRHTKIIPPGRCSHIRVRGFRQELLSDYFLALWYGPSHVEFPIYFSGADPGGVGPGS